MAKTHTSFRLEQRFVDLIDAWAEHLSQGRHRPTTRAEVLFTAVKKMKPPAEPGESETKVRLAYNAAFLDEVSEPAEVPTRVCEHPHVDFNGTMKICRDCKKVIR